MKHESTYYTSSTNLLYLIVLICLMLSPSCEKEEGVDPIQREKDISEYIQSLSYDPEELLNVQPIDESLSKNLLFSETTPEMDGHDLIVCTVEDYNLQQNAEQVAILRPTNGIIWPGALVKVNEGLLNGLPEPVTLKHAPTTLRIDLPGMGSHGTIVVDEPSNSNTQTAIDDALDWWNNNQYEEGYVNASNSSYCATTSFSSKQLAMELGLNVKWAGGSVSTQFNYTSTSTSKVAMMTFKQVFYTVTFDTPSSPGKVFDPSIDPQIIRNNFSNSAPPGYVHSVSYGRIIMFRMETNESATCAEVEGAMKYSTGVTSVSAELESKYQCILQNSSIDVITIGGNAEVASEAVTAQNFGDLEPILTGENAVYSKNNPGVPIAYTVKFLRNNKIAKMGYTTDYRAEECRTSYCGRIKVYGPGWYIARFTATGTKYDGSPFSYSSGNITAGNSKYCVIPGGTTNIKVQAKSVSCATIFTKYYDLPEDHCFTTGGTVCFPNYKEVGCDFD
jgi:hypothetical protein